MMRHAQDAERPSRITAESCGAAAVVLGAAAIYGWHTDNAVLLHVMAGLPAPSRGAGLGMVLAGLGLMALAAGRRRVAIALGILTAFTGLLGLADTAGSVVPSLDRLRMPQIASPAGVLSGPMGFNTAVCLVLSGELTAYLATNPPAVRRRLLGGPLAACITAVGTVAFIGYVSGLAFTYDWAGVAPMAVHASVGFMALGAGLCVWVWRESLGWDTLGFVFWGIAFPVTVIGAAYLLLGGWNQEHIAAHAAVETTGAAAALALALAFLWRYRDGRAWDALVPASALLATGVLSFVHALGEQSDQFVWYYALVNLAGGALMALIWLPERLRKPVNGLHLFAGAGLAAVALVLATMILPQLPPRMLKDGQFTALADYLNLAGGVFFLVAGARFIQLYLAERTRHTYVAALVCLLFGASGVLFQVSVLWDAAWWSWHAMRFAAFGIALVFVIREREQRESELRRAHIGLRNSEEHFRALMEQAADAFFVMDARGRFTDVNRRACESLGYAAHELIGLRPNDIDEMISSDRVTQLIARAEQGEVITVEGLFRRKDGSTFPVEVRVGRIQTEGVTAFLASARDITERRKAEDALRESEERLRTLAGTVPCAIYRCALDDNWTMVFISAQIERITGYPAADFIDNAARSYASVIWRDDAAEVQRAVMEGAARDEPWSIDYRIVHAGGSLRWVHEEGRAVHDGAGRPRHLDGFILDQTARVAAEQELRERTKELQWMVTELNRINQELDQFAYVASHDLQEPLRTLITYSGFLQEDLGDGLPEGSREDIRLLVDAAQRMQGLVRDLLAFSRSGRVELDKAPVPLDACVNSALANLGALIRETGARIRRAPLPEMEVDKTLITQVFQNLLGNALKFRKDGPPNIDVTAEKTNGRWVLGIRDDGIGIEKEYREQIFAPFKRLHSIGEYEGSGIGLAVCRRIVERHGGNIWVESDPGRGSHFRFTLGTWKGDSQ